MEEKLYGIVKWFNDHKGYGFIHGDDGNSYFVHYTGIIVPDGQRKRLDADARVSFTLGENHKGTIAENVMPE